MQILPGMSDILSILPSVNPRLQQPCLQFTYWSIVYMEQTVQGSQVPKRTKHNGIFQHRSVIGLTTLCLKCVSIFSLSISFLLSFLQRTALASTLRHIGEELYKPQVEKLPFWIVSFWFIAWVGEIINE